MRAEDPDGIDSVWVIVDAAVKGDDGGFNKVFSSRFRFVVTAGRNPGDQVPVAFRARDIAGFEVTRDTYVVVVP